MAGCDGWRRRTKSPIAPAASAVSELTFARSAVWIGALPIQSRFSSWYRTWLVFALVMGSLTGVGADGLSSIFASPSLGACPDGARGLALCGWSDWYGIVTCQQNATCQVHNGTWVGVAHNWHQGQRCRSLPPRERGALVGYKDRKQSQCLLWRRAL